MDKKIIGGIVALLAIAAVAWFSVTYFEVDAAGDFELPSIDVDADGGQMPEYDVEQEQEAELPDVDVQGEAGEIPEVEVRGPDVEVGTDEMNVPVPDIDMKETDVTVPDVDIEQPGEEYEPGEEEDIVPE